MADKRVASSRKALLDCRSGRFFWKVTAFPKTILAISVAVTVAIAAFLPKLHKDTRSDAFIPSDDPALVYRDRVREVFGLADPMVLAVVNEGPRGIFNPETLRLIKWMTERVSAIPGVDPDRIKSLSTEKNIFSSADGVRIERFFEEPPATQRQADHVRAAVMDSPLHLGRLVSRNGQAALIAAELADQSQADEVYLQLLELSQRAPVGGETIHVAGEGAVSGYLGVYIDRDVMRLNPFACLVIVIVLFLAYRRLRGVGLPCFVVGGAVVIALGAMAAFSVPFYPITSALPVILVALGVADGIHILGQYYIDLARWPQASHREIVAGALAEVWRPITFTSLTDVAGFAGLAFGSVMPPMQMFGLFASLGVIAALALSLFGLTAFLVLLKPRRSPAYPSDAPGREPVRSDLVGAAMGALGVWVANRPGAILIAAGVVVAIGLAGASQLQVNEERIENFQSSEPIVLADRAINRFFDGSNYLDVVVETAEPEGLFDPDRLRRIEKLQRFLETLPHVKGTNSIVDYLKQLNRAFNGGSQEQFKLPEHEHAVAQYFLLFSAAGDPGDLAEKVDFDYRLANVRVSLDTGQYGLLSPVVEAAEEYIRTEFKAPGISANLAGRVNTDYHWVKRLSETHLQGAVFAMVSVLLMAALSFRSLAAGLAAVIPVSLAVLATYAAMGFSGVWLGVGTSMFAAIAIGTGVDFAIHILDGLRGFARRERLSVKEALPRLFPLTGRALVFNFSAVFFGFGLLMASQLPPLIRLGAFTALSVLVSFVASLTVLPALAQRYPRIVGGH